MKGTHGDGSASAVLLLERHALYLTAGCKERVRGEGRERGWRQRQAA